jgi:chromosome segregation ATPase
MGQENNSSELSILTKQIADLNLDGDASIDVDVDAELQSLFADEARVVTAGKNIDANLAAIALLDAKSPTAAAPSTTSNKNSIDRRVEPPKPDRKEQQAIQQKLESRTHQLAVHNKKQLEKAEKLLAAFETIRQQILTGLSKFGSYEEFKTTLDRMVAAQAELARARQRLDDKEAELITSIKTVERSTVAVAISSEKKLAQYQESISIYKEKVQAIERELTLKIADIERYHREIGNIHDLLKNKSSSIQERLSAVESEFATLRESVREDKLQFYELTAETIDKTQHMEAQFAKLSNQVAQNHENLDRAQTTLEVLRGMVDGGIAESAASKNIDYEDLLADVAALRDSKRKLAQRLSKFSLWLWLLSFAFGTAIVLFIALLLRFR